jgi:hypothetical protein
MQCTAIKTLSHCLEEEFMNKCIAAIQYQLLRQENLNTRAEVKGGILLLVDHMYKITWGP